VSRKTGAMEIISRLIAQREAEVAEHAVLLWTALAAELTPIVGETGFITLYSRSLHITQRTFTWLAPIPSLQQADSGFTVLQTRLAGQTSSEAVKACEVMLVTFIDILALLIGEALTTVILRAAWGNDVSENNQRSSLNE
jgi:hypothetical protein